MSETDAIAVVPCFDQKHDVLELIAPDVKQVVHFVGHRPDVEAAEDDFDVLRRRVTIDVNMRQK